MRLKDGPFAIGITLAIGTLAVGFTSPPLVNMDVGDAAVAQRQLEILERALQFPEISEAARDAGVEEHLTSSQEYLEEALVRIRDRANRRELSRFEYVIAAALMAFAGTVISQRLTILDLQKNTRPGDRDSLDEL